MMEQKDIIYKKEEKKYIEREDKNRIARVGFISHFGPGIRLYFETL